MVSPQKENGYTAIANEIMDQLSKTRIPGVERQVLDFILRKTYGFNKLSDRISGAQFAEGTGLKKQHIYRAIKNLVSKKIVTKKGYGNNATYRFNKVYTSWKLSPKKVIKKIKSGKALNLNNKNSNNGEYVTNNGYAENGQSVTNNGAVVTNNGILLPIDTKVDKQKTGGRRKKKKEKYKPPTGIELKNNGRDWIDNEAWDMWIEFRKELGKPLKTKAGTKRQLNILKKYKSKQREIIENSINSEWTGLYEPKGKSGYKQPRAGADKGYRQWKML